MSQEGRWAWNPGRYVGEELPPPIQCHTKTDRCGTPPPPTMSPADGWLWNTLTPPPLPIRCGLETLVPHTMSCHRKIRGSGHRKVRECGTPVSHTMAHEARACHTLKTPSPIQCHRRIRGRGIPVPHTMSREPRACHTRMCGCGKPFPLMCNTRTQVGAPNAQNCSFTATRRPVFGYNIIMLRRGELPGQFFGLKWG